MGYQRARKDYPPFAPALRFTSLARISHVRTPSIMAGRGFGRGLTNDMIYGEAPRSSLSFTTPPPDLSQICDGNLLVSFKGLLKKNDTTLAKALEEIRSYVRSKREGDSDKFDLIDFSRVIYAWVSTQWMCGLPQQLTDHRLISILVLRSIIPVGFAN